MDEARGLDEAPGLDDTAVEQRMARLDAILGQLEVVPGRTAELALQAVETMTEIYGEALRRVVTAAGGGAQLLAACPNDELVRHLLLLHRIHPDPVDARAARAVADLVPQLRSQGVSAHFTGVRDNVAHVTVSSISSGSSGSCGGCGTNAELAEVVRRHVTTMAPELADVEVSAPAALPALIPVSSLSRRAGVAEESRR